MTVHNQGAIKADNAEVKLFWVKGPNLGSQGTWNSNGITVGGNLKNNQYICS